MGEYHCSLCGTNSKTSSNYLKHCRTKKHISNLSGQTREKVYKCEPCSFQTNRKRDLDGHKLSKKHIRKESDCETFECFPCAFSTTRRWNFLKHQQSEKHKKTILSGTIVSEEDIEQILGKMADLSQSLFPPQVVADTTRENTDLIRPCILPPYASTTEFLIHVWLKQCSSYFLTFLEENEGFCILKIDRRKYFFRKEQFYIFALKLAQIADAACRLNAIKEFERFLSMGYIEDKSTHQRSCWKKGQRNKRLDIDFYSSSRFSGKIWKRIEKETKKGCRVKTSENFTKFWLLDSELREDFSRCEAKITKRKEFKMQAETVLTRDVVFGETLEYTISDAKFLEVVSSFSFDVPKANIGAMVKSCLTKVLENVSPTTVEEIKFLFAFKSKVDEVISNTVFHCYGIEKLSDLSKGVIGRIVRV
ncbi:hypothetical protein GMAR_ORF55 [Golden Marseillevirus]|uniref:hypothetical protein n=1 Tax=Golden Marseillevirus TaxID=1720526 RepID=UPI000877AE00|nr:hypothetical protein GMAR_ORF55 [Golden Marseillevirus]ALX27430.1 hypothetical protein GMAR_ORF55 [Golden Marseillevirus]